MSGNEKTFSVTEPILRLDRFLADMLRPEGFSREKIKQLILQGHARVNSQICDSPKALLRKGQIVSISLPDTQNTLVADSGELNVVYKDAQCLVLSKPAGLTVHPCPSCPDGTMVNRLVFHFPELRGMEGTRPGIVHRLDKDTSGLILVALKEKTRLALAEAFAERRVTKEYLALVKGVPVPSEADITVPVGRHPTYKTKMAAFPGMGKKTTGSTRTAHSHYRVLFADPEGRFSLVLVGIHTGRTHQIRVHMAHIGHPLWGDPLYGGPTHLAADGSCLRLIPETMENTEIAEADDTELFQPEPTEAEALRTREPHDFAAEKAPALPKHAHRAEEKTFADVPEGARPIASRQMLHAFHLSFIHPETGNELELYDPLPPDFKKAVIRLLSRPLHVIVTGLPGCGKSSLIRALEHEGAPVWSADACVRALYEPGNDGWALLRGRFGDRFIQADSAPVNKAELFAAMCAEPGLRREVEELIHPLVEHDLSAFRNKSEQNAAISGHATISVAEVPLFLEVENAARGTPRPKYPYPDPVLVGVFCPDQERHARLAKFRHVPQYMAEKLDSWQWDTARKIRACHFIIDNSGSPESMTRAARHLLELLKKLQENRARKLAAKALQAVPLNLREKKKSPPPVA